MISRIVLHNFRNHCHYDAHFDGLMHFIVGPNGIGKTSILEAISFFASKNGIRNANFQDVQNFHTKSPWRVILEVLEHEQSIMLELSADGMLLNGSKVFKKDISDIVNSIWINPSMLNILDNSQSMRRALLDKMIASCYSTYNNKIYAYHALSRRRIDSLLRGNDQITSIIENDMSQIACSIAFERQQFIYDINPYIMEGRIDIEKIPFNPHDFELNFAKLLLSSRDNDRKSERSNVNFHYDISVYLHDIEASYCSTGQCSLLILHLAIAWSYMIKKIKGTAPAILLDDAMSHIDQYGIEKFEKHIKSIGAQVFCTAVSANNIQSHNWCIYDMSISNKI